MPNLKVCAYLQNSHWQKNTKEKNFEIWVKNTITKFNSDFPNINIDLDVINENEEKNKDWTIIKNYIEEKDFDVFLGLPKQFIIKNPINLFQTKLFFTNDDLDDIIENYPNIFSTYSKLFNSINAMVWISKMLKVKKVLLFHKQDYDMKHIKNEFKKLYNSCSFSSFKLEDKFLESFDLSNVIRDTDKFIYRLKNNKNEFVSKINRYISSKNIKIESDILIVHDIGLYSTFFLTVLKQINSDLKFFDLGRTSWVPEKTQKYFQTYSIFPRYNMNKEIRSYFPSLHEFELFDLQSAYRDVYDPIFCLGYLSTQHKINDLSKKDLIHLLSDALKMMHQNKDIYVGMFQNYRFKNNIISNRESFFYKQGEILEKNKNLPLYFPYQPIDKFSKYLEVWFLYLDIIKITEIDISKGLWFCELELEINSTEENSIEKINFRNNSPLDDLWDVKLINHFKIENRYQTKYRVHASFDFNPSNENFPFDIQTLELEYYLEPSVKNSILQPIPKDYVDDNFNIKGWEIIDSQSGIYDKKSYEKLGTDLDTYPLVSSNVMCHWKVKRKNKISAIKSFIPLYILIFLSWYSSFLDSSESTTAVGLNTTVFLAGIALYFSADRPSTTVLTIIDKFFISFYTSVAILILSEFSIFINKTIYFYTHLIWQILIPVLVISSIIFLISKR